MPKITRSLSERFFEKVEKTEDCWIWTAFKLSDGYGRFTTKRGVCKLAHRVSFELHFGEIPKGQVCLHKCDNPSCVRPDHLVLGSQWENVQDMIHKGRAVVLKGTKHGQAKLTEYQVQQIRKMHNRGVPARLLAEQFGVHRTTIHRAVTARNWAHVKTGATWR